MTNKDLTAGEGRLPGVTLLPGVRMAEVGAPELEALLAEPAGTLVAVCCVRGQAALALPQDASLSCGEVLSLVTSGAGEKCRVRPQEGPFQGVALMASTGAVAPGAAATLAGFDVDLAELVDAMARAGRVVDIAGSAVSQAFLDLAVGARGEGVAALKLRCVEALRCLCEARRQAAAARRGPTSRADIARLARSLMRQNVESPLTIGELARRCQTSPTVLKESFRAEYGMPVHEWYRRFRMLKAADLLRVGSGSISDVARAVGYSNASKFAQAFCACMGATPSAWRRAALTSVAATEPQLSPELAKAV